MPRPPAAVTRSAVSSIVSGRFIGERPSRVVRPVQYTVAPRAPSSTAMPRPAPRVAPATLVQRFGSKRALLLAVAAAGPAVIASAFAAARQRRRTALGALEDALAGLASSIDDPDEVANHLAFLALDLADPDFRTYAARDTGAFREGIEALLREASTAGEFAARSRKPLAELLQAAYHGALLMWAIEREGSPEQRVREHVRLALRPYRSG